MELLAKLDNFGPFNMFFTLSCADTRWQENFSSLLHKLDMNVTHSIDDLTHEVRTIVTIDGETLSLEEYLDDRRYCDETRHTQIKKHVVQSTRNFDYRLKQFMKHIML